MLGPVTNIPLSIIEYWHRFLSKEEEISSHHIDDIIYVSVYVKAEFTDPLKVYASKVLAKLVYGEVFILLEKGPIYDREWLSVKEYERLINLKAFW